jgi:hypothetical protein
MVNDFTNHLRKISRIDYLGNFPKHRNSGWSEKLQGVTHDADNWFFTQVNHLWKFPISHDLNKKVTSPESDKGILRVGIPGQFKGYDHFGDPDHHRGFIFVPLEGDGKAPQVLVFKASNLDFVASYLLPQQNKAGWIAVHPKSGLLYTSNSTIDVNQNPIFIYEFKKQEVNKFKLELRRTIHLKNESGQKISIRPYLQGGTFSSDGDTLFLANGKARKFDSDDGGIWVFSTRDWKKVMKSRQGGEFKFEFHPGATKYEEPEGITFWDLDNDRREPRIPGGQLHAILLDNDWTNKDEFYFKHYRIHYEFA